MRDILAYLSDIIKKNLTYHGECVLYRHDMNIMLGAMAGVLYATENS